MSSADPPPSGTSSTLEAALHHHRAGEHDRALGLYREVLQKEPRNERALYSLSVLFQSARDYSQGLDFLSRAIDVAPSNPIYHCNQGECYRHLGRNEEAVTAFVRALSLSPEMFEAFFNLGLVWQALGKVDVALSCFECAADLRPDVFLAQRQLASTLRRVGQLERAVGHYQCALALNPQSLDILLELASLLRTLSRTAGAVNIARRGVTLAPSSALAHAELGACLLQYLRLDEAMESLRRAIELDPGLPAARFKLGMALFDSGQAEQAVAEYRRVIDLQPDDAVAHSNIVFIRMFDPGSEAGAILEEARGWCRRFADPLAGEILHSNDRDPDRRLRVGYVSPSFREHCQELFTTPLFAHHDHTRIETYAYSSVQTPDASTDRLRAHCDHWRDIRALDDAAAAELVRQDAIDILVDLTMHMGDGRLRLFARNPAPIQICWLAYPGTTGLGAMDYRITDPYLDPPEVDALGLYSEKSIVLPDTFWCYDPLTREPEVGALPAVRNGFVTFGCLNGFHKINSSVLEVWGTVLKKARSARLLMLAPPGESRKRVLQSLERSGVDPSRVEFVARQSRQDYLRTYQRIDVGLDTWPANGHTTSLDAYWMGVPTVSLVGKTVLARAGLSQATNLGLPELAADTPEAFTQAAVRLVEDWDHLAELRAGLRRRMENSPLMDGARFARNLEKAYRSVWVKWTALGLALGLLAACGGSGRTIHKLLIVEDPDETGSPVSSDGGSGAPTTRPRPTKQPEGGDGPSDAQPAFRDSGLPSIRSGTRACQDPRECFLLTCELNDGGVPGSCVSRCSSPADCDDASVCMSFAAVASSCFVVCDSPTDCAYGYDCVDYFGNGQYACLPIAWVATLP